MTEIYRKLEVHFSKSEIEEMLIERAKKMMRADGVRPDEHRVCHVEGEAVVTLTVWPADVRRRMKAEAATRNVIFSKTT